MFGILLKYSKNSSDTFEICRVFERERALLLTVCFVAVVVVVVDSKTEKHVETAKSTTTTDRHND